MRLISNLERCRDETGSKFPGFGLHPGLGFELGSDLAKKKNIFVPGNKLILQMFQEKASATWFGNQQ